MVHRGLIPSLLDWMRARAREILSRGRGWTRWRGRAAFLVRGNSMAPTLLDGDRVWIDLGAYRREPPRPGDVVLVRHPYRSDLRLVKRVVAVGAAGEVGLVGDNPEESTDSRDFGPVRRDLIQGRVLVHPA